MRSTHNFSIPEHLCREPRYRKMNETHELKEYIQR